MSRIFRVEVMSFVEIATSHLSATERHTTCVNGAESIYNWIWAIGTSLVSQRGPDCLGTSSYGATWPPKVVDWLSGCKMTGCKMCDDATMQTTLRAGK